MSMIIKPGNGPNNSQGWFFFYSFFHHFKTQSSTKPQSLFYLEYPAPFMFYNYTRKLLVSILQKNIIQSN